MLSLIILLKNRININYEKPPSDEAMKKLEGFLKNIDAENIDADVREIQDLYNSVLPHVFLYNVRRNLEIRIRQIFSLVHENDQRRNSLVRNLMSLYQMEIIDGLTVDLIKQVVAIANQAIHGEKVTSKYIDFVKDAYPQIMRGLSRAESTAKQS